jgi:amino acid adenylation domain-containing protein
VRPGSGSTAPGCAIEHSILLCQLTERQKGQAMTIIDGGPADVRLDTDAVPAACAGVNRDVVLLAAFLATLFRYTRQETFEVGMERPGGTMAFPVSLDGRLSFAELARDAAGRLAELPRVPGEGASGGSVGRVTFAARGELRGARPAPDGSVIGCLITEHPGGYGARMTFPDNSDAGSWRASCQTLLDDAVRRPDTPLDELRVFPDEAGAAAVAAANSGFDTYTRLRPIHGPFEEQARQNPDAIAVEVGADSVTYRDLDQRANRLAHKLHARGIGSESLVGVLVDRSADMVAALLGVLKAGAGFVPLDARLPKERIAMIAADAAMDVIVTQERHRELVAGPDAPPVVLIEAPSGSRGRAADVTPPDVTVSLDNTAYVYYTSGSTGTPKGVVIDHRCAAGRLEWLARRYQLCTGDRVLHKTPLIFDVAIWEIFGPLGSGATVLMADAEAESDVTHLSRLLAAERTVFAHFVPSMLNAYLKHAPRTATPGLRWIQMSGEAAPARLHRESTERFSAELHNMYGQTETSEVAAWEGGPLAGARGLPIGRQIGIYRLFVLDAALNPVPAGMPGELCVAGVGGLARGYRGRPALTADRFVPNPYAVVPGERLYRTGDLVAADADGVLTYRGRIDNQVKIRGCRVETGEVESVLMRHQGLVECAVTVHQDRDGDDQLVAYVVGDEPAVDDLALLAEQLLPSYMHPAAYMRLAALPRTPSGKVDRLRLPAPSADDLAARAGADDLRTRLEQEVAEMWKEVLGVDTVGRGDRFFAVGGTSLKSLQILNRISTTFGVQVSVRDFFTTPTIESLAASIESALLEKLSAMSDEEAAELLARLG